MSAGGASGPRSLPRDAKVIAAMLKELDVTDYEPRMVNQLLEFSYKYIADVLEDAKSYSEYADKKMIDREDVQLAIQMKQENSFSQLPPRELLAELARERNAIPLPPLKPGYGLRLPSDRYCLLQTNYKMKPNKQILIGTPRYPPSMAGAQTPGQTIARYGPPRNLSTMGGGGPSSSSGINPSVVVSKQLANSSGFMPPPPPGNFPPGGGAGGSGMYGSVPGGYGGNSSYQQQQQHTGSFPPAGVQQQQSMSGYGGNSAVGPPVSHVPSPQLSTKPDAPPAGGGASRPAGVGGGGRSLFRIVSGDPPAANTGQQESRKRKREDNIDEDYDQF